MPHVSNRKLDKSTRKKIFEKMILVFSYAKSHKDLAQFLDELLTETEKVMLAKRLAVVLMLNGNTPQHRIAEALSVSTSTVKRLSLGAELGKYKFINNISVEEKIDLEKLIWKVLTVGGIMPPRIGKTYWRKRGMKATLELRHRN